MSFLAVEKFADDVVVTRYIIVCENHVLCSQSNDVFFSREVLEQLLEQGASVLDSCPLGFFEGEACEAVYLESEICLPGQNSFWTALRPLLGVIPDEVFYLVGRATQLRCWLTEHQFCGRCGSTTRKAKTDRALVCTQCKLRFYPKISPCVMVLVTRDDECLLASGVQHKAGMYTALAGFIEAGESAEQAGTREVREEVGLEIHNLTYFGSQPWPFPGQLMIAYTAEYRSGNICIDEKEIIDANWYRYDSLPNVPPASTIARQLIEQFVKTRTSVNEKLNDQG